MSKDGEYMEVLYKDLMDALEKGDNITRMRWAMERYVAYKFKEKGDMFRVTHMVSDDGMEITKTIRKDYKQLPVALAHAKMI